MGMEAARRADPSGAGEGGLDSAIGVRLERQAAT
jgi:hypothetical protein